MKTPQELGKEFEENFRLWLKQAVCHHRVAFVRLYDTRSAGSFLPDQPGDFLASINGRSHLFELKSSEKFPSLQAGGAMRQLITDAQAANARIWSRSGAQSHFIYWGQHSNIFEVWDGEYVGSTYVIPRSKLREPAQFQGNSFTELTDFITQQWMIP